MRILSLLKDMERRKNNSRKGAKIGKKKWCMTDTEYWFKKVYDMEIGVRM